MRRIAILGCTGSIGHSTLNVIENHPERFELVTMAAGGNVESALQQARRWKPKVLSLASEQDAETAARQLKQEGLGLEVWQRPFVPLRAPLITNLRMDPFERAEEENAMGYQRWYMDHMFAIAPAGAYVARWLQSFREFPPRQKPGSFNLDRVMEAISKPQDN